MLASAKRVFFTNSLDLEILPTPQAARYNRAGEPNPPAPTTKMDDFNKFDCPTTNLRTTHLQITYKKSQNKV